MAAKAFFIVVIVALILATPSLINWYKSYTNPNAPQHNIFEQIVKGVTYNSYPEWSTIQDSLEGIISQSSVDVTIITDANPPKMEITATTDAAIPQEQIDQANASVCKILADAATKYASVKLAVGGFKYYSATKYSGYVVCN
ncbi:MAG TPA: hypothetical protein VLI92_00215 [Candidatus Saccharimonadales bacterium]|nr:hypothetical protein [Candidatus Saccharimonadales bacterium]